MNNAVRVLPTINPEKLVEGWQLKKLSQKHKNIIALHAQNVKREDIGKTVGCTPEYVSMIMQQPLAREYMRDLEKYMDSRLEALYGRSVDVIQNGLDGDATDTQLKAARLQLEVTGKLKPKDSDKQTAEDVVSALLKYASSGGVIAIGNNVQVNTGD
jgi:hypothetical protein